MNHKNTELKVIFWFTLALFSLFLLIPLLVLFQKTVVGDHGLTMDHFRSVLGSASFFTALGHSFLVAAASSMVATALAFVMAYAVHYTLIPAGLKKFFDVIAMLPMFLPTITYGFAIIYSFGRQGLLTRLLGRQLFDLYGFFGLMTGYVIYTLPVAYLLIRNTMQYVDKKTLIVSKIMGDGPLSTFWIAVFRPLLGTLVCAFIQAFFLSFTDFGIPASVGGKYTVVATILYNTMLGGIPDFGGGAVVAVIMLIPSVGSVVLLHIVEKYNIRYTRISTIDLRPNAGRDIGWSIAGCLVACFVLSVLAVVFVVPLVESWPYKTNVTLQHFRDVFADSELTGSFVHSVVMSLLSAFIGTLIAYGAALITARSRMSGRYKKTIDSLAMITSAIPGMVIGVAYMFVFPGTPLQNTLTLMILCNIIHYFSTPYLMMKNSLLKLNSGWETTAMLMGDNWFQTIGRVITPNALSSLIDVFSYYFINSMVTISALIFIAGARTMVMTTKIKQLQYINKFNEVFVLSLLIFFTNVVAKAVFSLLSKKLAQRSSHRQKMEKAPQPKSDLAA